MDKNPSGTTIISKRDFITAIILFLFFLSAVFSVKAQEKKISVPAEEHIHSNKIEWWYHFGYLKSPSDEKNTWAFYSSFIRSCIGRCVMYKLTNLQTGKNYSMLQFDRTLRTFSFVKKKDRTFFPLAEFSLFNPDNSISLHYGKHRFKKETDTTYILHLEEDSLWFSLNLRLDTASPPMLMEGAGMIGLDKPDQFYYYTFPHVEASGLLILPGYDTLHLDGDCWYDHQWGNPLSHSEVASWRWWGINLDNGESFNIYSLKNRKEESLKKIATRLTKEGKTLVSDSIRCTPHRFWKSPRTGITYPVEWTIEFPEWNMNFHITPLFDDHEMPILIYKYFWEGPCTVTVTERATGMQISAGKGYQELVGYAYDKIKAKLIKR